MILIIPSYRKIIITYIGARSHIARVPRLSNVKRKADIIMRRTRHSGMKLKSWLNKLFDPINRNSNAKRNKSIFPVQRIKNQNIYTQRQISKRKEVPPDKLRCLLGFNPNILNSIHGFSPLHPFILPLLSLRKPIKNNIFFNRSQKLCL